MVALFWNSDRREITPPHDDSAMFFKRRDHITTVLVQLGFPFQRVSPLDVFGSKAGVIVSIAHFHIGGNSFFEVVMAAGDSEEATVNTRDEVVNKLRALVL